MRGVLRDRKVLALILIGAVALGSYAISPAIGGGPLGVKKAKKLFYTKKRVNATFAPLGSAYTKAESDARYPSSTAVYTKAESDARYPSSTAQTKITVGPLSALNDPGSGGHTLFPFPTGASYRTTGSSFGQAAVVPLTLPVRQFGLATKLLAIEYCYDTDSNSTLSDVSIRSLPATAVDPEQADVVVVSSPTNRTDASCRSLAPANPYPIGEESLFLRMSVNYSAAGEFEFFRATITLSP